jgi:hypothetical protein
LKKHGWVIIGLLALVAVVATLAVVIPADAGKLEEALAKTPSGTGKGEINPDAPKGFMGIPGAPKPFWFCGVFGWVGSFPPWAPSAASWPGWAI